MADRSELREDGGSQGDRRGVPTPGTRARPASLADVQAVTAPGRFPPRVCDVVSGPVHDLTAARDHVLTPVEQPGDKRARTVRSPENQ